MHKEKTSNDLYTHTGTIPFVLLLLFIPNIASANAMVPLLFLSMPFMLAALVPIIILEGWILYKRLGISFKKAVLACGVANVATTVIGYPLAGILMLMAEDIFIPGGGGLFGIVSSFSTALLIDFALSYILAFFISVLFEYLILRKFFKSSDKRELKKAVWLGNAISYVLFILLLLPSLRIVQGM